MVAAFGYNRLATPDARSGSTPTRSLTVVYCLGLATALMIGLRFEVGGDWIPYLGIYDQIQLMDFSQAIMSYDPAYSAIVFIAGRLDSGIWLANLACGVIMTFSIIRFCSRQPNPALTFLVAVPYLVIVVGMGYTRQAVAIGILLAGLADVDRQSTVKLIVYVFVAALFHKTALLVLPLILAPVFRRSVLQSIFGVIVFVALFFLFLRSQTDDLINNYIDSDYASSGAVVRVAMNIVPAVIAIVLRKKMRFSAYQDDMWTAFAVVALLTLPLVLTVSFTTAIDRLALFLIPLQIAILPRLPYVFAGSRSLNAQLTLAVCAYSASVQMVWLVFATNAEFWLPYRAFFINAG